MICQSCHKTATPFLRFALMIDPRSVRCVECGAELQMSCRSLRAWWGSLIFGAVIVIASVILRRIIGWGLLTNLLGIIVFATILSWSFWRSATYEVKPQEPPGVRA